MLTISPLTSVRNERESLQMQGFSMDEVEFPEFTTGNLLDSIDFDDIFVGINGGDVLPDLEMDGGEIQVDFEESEAKIASVFMEDEINRSGNYSETPAAESGSVSGSDVGFGSSGVIQGEEVVSKSEESVVNNKSSRKSSGKSRKSHSKNPPGKKKAKVDWTPELHRRFVQAVEQLGLDKAVPSRILEIMGNDSLTRHNIASHLQKYRSHRKHLQAREAEAASWSQRRQMYAAPPIAGGPAKRDQSNPWIAPTMGFPPVAPMPHFRPLHVWGHPSVDQSLMPMWPNHVAPPPHAWPAHHPLPPSPTADPSFWPHSHGQYVPTTGTPWFPPHLPPMRFQSPPVAGVPPPAMYKVEPGVPATQTLPKPAPSDVLPSKESIDAAIGDVLTKPWLPLPLGLKPPSVDSVMTELQRQGVSDVPPKCS